MRRVVVLATLVAVANGGLLSRLRAARNATALREKAARHAIRAQRSAAAATRAADYARWSIREARNKEFLARNATARALAKWRETQSGDKNYNGGRCPPWFDVCLFHVPRTAGASLKSQLHLDPSFGATLWSKEVPIRSVARARPSQIRAALFRNPRDHVLSQYMQCRDGPSGLRSTRGTAFPRASRRYRDFRLWLAHFENFERNPDAGDFRCYDPRDMQARYLTYTCKNRCAHHVDASQPPPDKATAVAGLDQLDVVGVVEHYAASVCLLRATVNATLPEKCFCGANRTRYEMRLRHGVDEAARREGKTPHTLADLSQRVHERIDAVTVVDRAVYRAALIRFLADVRALERRLGDGRRILCEEAVRDLTTFLMA